MKPIHSFVLSAIALFVTISSALGDPSLGLSTDIVSATALPGSFPLLQNRQAAMIDLDNADYPGVFRAAGDLQADIERVSGVRPEVKISAGPVGRIAVMVGTLGKSGLIDGLVSAGKINVSAIKGKWESFLIATVDQPMAGVDQALVIVGSDKRGTIYGVYEISEQIGVSPWYWWADVPDKHHDALFIKPGVYEQGPPAVRYRGIFINDEEPCLGGWTRAKYGGVNSKMYTRMFELILRLRGNYLWPAMWGKAFNEDDPLNPKLADEYGVVMGTSHHEPLMRAQQEWTKHKASYGNEWNYLTNEAGLKQFWTDGVVRNKSYENIYTIGMRGDGDVAMPDAGGLEANKKLLEKIITDQREIIARNVNPDLDKVPQLWALFTEVQKYYDAGLKLPDDVTLLFTDDNVGNIRRVPTPAERSRVGGAGIYFHMDMNGGPYSYKWLNTNPLPKVWEQMNLVHAYGANQIWIVNVGDLKPLEIPLEFFLRMGWDPEAMKGHIADYELRWAQREFGPEHAAEIADLAGKYAKYNAWRKPEVVRPDTYSLVNYQEAERVSQAWDELADKAQKLSDRLPKDQRDAFYELILHPVLACSNFNDLYIAAGRNVLYAKQGRASANAEAARVRQLFKRDQDLSDYYNHQLAGGKWNHMMDQTHIGYSSWQSPVKQIMPALTQVKLHDDAAFGVAVEGSTEAWPGGATQATLPTFDSLSRHPSYLEIFARGSKPIDARATADQTWIKLAEDKVPNAGQDQRIWVDLDWSAIPAGESSGAITIADAGASVTVNIRALKASDDQEKAAKGCFAALAGPISFLAADATKNIPAGDVRWEMISDYGRGASAMEVFPVTAESIKLGEPAPRLEYPVFFAAAGTYSIDLITGPTLNIIPSRGLRVAVSLDDLEPNIANVFAPSTARDEDFLGRNHFANTSNNARTMHFAQRVDAPGRHTLKISMVDPTIVLQQVIIHEAPLPPSYFGPPEATRSGG